MTRSQWAATACAVALAASLAGACTKGAVEPLPPAPKVPETTTTVAVDLSGIGLAAVPGRTTTTLALQPGHATISGAVVGPEGRVAGAVVRAERLVDDATGSLDVVTGPDGTFAFTSMLGGRFRIRAWKPAPDNLALTAPEVFFLESRESKVLTLTVRPFQGIAVSSDIAPSPPLVGEPANLVVQVVDQVVDAQGIVRSVPVTGARVELFGAGDWRLRSNNPVATDGAGRATFTLECQRTGPQPLSVVVGDASTFPLELPACGPRPEPEEPATTTPSSTSTTSRSGTTTTTGRTTTTTRPTTTTR